MTYLQRTYDLPAELEDEFSAALWKAGTLGAETVETEGRVRLEAWFEPGAEEVEGAPAWRERGVAFLGEAAAPVIDWLAAYRASAVPFPVGERFVVDPREPGHGEGPELGEEGSGGRVVLRLPARTAFGTGSHESTALAVELLEETDLLNRSLSVLDVGTGTGILSFAALMLADPRQTSSAVAFDLDPAAAFAARDNARLNTGVLGDLRPRLFAGTSQALSPESCFDLLLVNVIPEEIAPALPSLISHLAPGGELIFSGILTERGAEVVAELARLGCDVAAEKQAGEWVAYRFRAATR